MTLVQRIKKSIGALAMLLCAFLMVYLGEAGYGLVMMILCVSSILSGLRSIIFYFTMARHMVDGLGILFKGIILLDFGLFTMSISQNYTLFIVVYLLAIHAFSGVMAILHALEARRFHASSWRINLIEGSLNIAFAAAAVICGFVINSLKDVTWIYASSLFYSAILQLITVFRKTAIVYIQ